MTSIFEQAAEHLQRQSILDKQLPLHRRAYSDRTAWLMACFSELAYRRFNPPFYSIEQEQRLHRLLDRVSPQTRPKVSMLLQIIDSFSYDHKQEKQWLTDDIIKLNAKLERTYDARGSQAILIKTDNYLVLAFRGTEADCWKDIKADAKANLIPCETGGRVHAGFKRALACVEQQIADDLQHPDFAKLPLFITGHSLGGALATVAAKRITHQGGNAACYTYGSPRVADDTWLSTMKTPVYRVVNAADGVTTVPPKSLGITALAKLAGYVPVVGVHAKAYLMKHFDGYLHGGDMRYLTNVRDGEYDKAKLLFYVDYYYRLKGILNNKLPFWRAILSDHSISVYRRKLAHIALERNT